MWPMTWLTFRWLAGENYLPKVWALGVWLNTKVSAFKARTGAFAQLSGGSVYFGLLSQAIEQQGRVAGGMRTITFGVDEQEAEGAGPEFGIGHG